ncbi:MAG: UvrD-helicase domain-containing protein [Treponema sp.]|nr:UvrD-helicase domain-containing protein [Treponema sp.]
METAIEKQLNAPQLEAVKTLEGPVLIIAGAGSGKTRVITYRIAAMLKSGIPQHAILALTFTNKAAREMESRVKELTGKKLQSLTISTFHAFGVKILREEIEILGYRKNFSIYDETDRTELIKETLRECRMGSEKTNLYGLGQLFSNIKTGKFIWRNAPGIAGTAGELLEAAKYERVYKEYQNSLKVYNALDFDDLLVLPITIFENHPEILDKYRSRYRYFMVDEFQDTSLVQYNMLRILALNPEKSPANVCVVGDDDQSIYSWRGANYENLLMFEKDFPGVKEIKLEQNYRSTTTILEAANGVISHNTNRKEKKLWSGKTGDSGVELHVTENEGGEGSFISEKIREHMINDSLGYDAFGVLLRTNSLMHNIEEAFLEANIPYKVSGGMSFFQRKEIKDILSYMRVIANTSDDVNLLRIINTPRRGIGKNSIQTISDLARKNKTCLWDAMERLCRLPLGVSSPLAQKTRAELDTFMSMIESFRDRIFGRQEEQKKMTLAENVSSLVDHINYWSYLVAEFSKNEKIARWRYTNIEYFVQSIDNWEKDPDVFDKGLYAWLNRVSLINSSDDKDNEKGKVNLMTIHAAKGLEFPVVFIAAAEDGIIPHTRSLEDSALANGKENNENGESPALGPMEEERRLFYVAITRARDKLYITSCKQRRRLQETVECAPSPFLAEIPSHLIKAPDDSGDESIKAEKVFAKMRERFKNI